MQLDYLKILNENGFDSVLEAESTTLAFFHEIHNTLFEADSPFDEDKSSVKEFPNILDHMIYCSLPLKTGETIEKGVQYLVKAWYDRLSYLNPIFESIIRTSSPFGTEVRVFTLTAGTGCSFLFSITDEASRKFQDEFMESYSPVDNPEAVLKKIKPAK